MPWDKSKNVQLVHSSSPFENEDLSQLKHIIQEGETGPEGCTTGSNEQTGPERCIF